MLQNTAHNSLIEHRVCLAGFLIAIGLIIQLMTFIWIHPLAFISFAVIGCPLVAAGVLIFLYSLVFHQPLQNGNGTIRQDRGLGVR